MKRVLSITGLATAAVLGASTLAAAATTTAQAATSVAGVQVSASGWATGVNDRGDVIGGFNVDDLAHAFIWHAGTLTDLGTLPGLGGAFTDPTGLNDKGQILAYVYDNGLFESVILDHGKTISLLPTSGESASAGYLSDSGLIAGETEAAANVTSWQLPN